MDEIPLLKQSAVYVARLCKAADRYQDSQYWRVRRINWAHKYEEGYYAAEAAAFLLDPSAYYDSKLGKLSCLSDVWCRKLGVKSTMRIFVKVCLHWVFATMGGMQRAFWASKSEVYRKAYVDDIELVFSDETKADRFVYPFPISAKRQWRYMRWLNRSGIRYSLAGHSYLLSDLTRFLLRRDLRSLLRLEARAQIRHAKWVAKQGYQAVQLSDEYDLGSLEFSRVLGRHSVFVENGAHGVGKYLPYHRYDRFNVITKRQEQYYKCISKCNYQFTPLNLVESDNSVYSGEADAISLVFISQVVPGGSPLVKRAEGQTLKVIEEVATDFPFVRLFYRSHPNGEDQAAPASFFPSRELSDYGAARGIIYVSLFSTTHIDPNFVGRKLLVRTREIWPEVAFDDDDSIFSLDELPSKLRALVALGS